MVMVNEDVPVDLTLTMVVVLASSAHAIWLLLIIRG
jgi:hypothetical protein